MYKYLGDKVDQICIWIYYNKLSLAQSQMGQEKDHCANKPAEHCILYPQSLDILGKFCYFGTASVKIVSNK